MDFDKKILFSSFPEDVYSDGRIEEVVKKYGYSLRDEDAVRDAKIYLRREADDRYDEVVKGDFKKLVDFPMVWLSYREGDAVLFRPRRFSDYMRTGDAHRLFDAFLDGMRCVRIGTENGVLTIEGEMAGMDFYEYGRRMSKEAEAACKFKYADWEERCEDIDDPPSWEEHCEYQKFLKDIFESDALSSNVDPFSKGSGDDFAK